MAIEIPDQRIHDENLKKRRDGLLDVRELFVAIEEIYDVFVGVLVFIFVFLDGGFPDVVKRNELITALGEVLARNDALSPIGPQEGPLGTKAKKSEDMAPQIFGNCVVAKAEWALFPKFKHIGRPIDEYPEFLFRSAIESFAQKAIRIVIDFHAAPPSIA